MSEFKSSNSNGLLKIKNNKGKTYKGQIFILIVSLVEIAQISKSKVLIPSTKSPLTKIDNGTNSPY